MFCFIVLCHHRRVVVHFDATAHPTADWTARQIVEVFPENSAPRFLIRDRDGIYGQSFRECVKHMGIEEVVIAPRSPWQTPYVERLIGSIRREWLEHVIILNERHLLRILRSYFDYHLHTRTHLFLDRKSPVEREIESPEHGEIIAIPQVGGLHHRYARAA
ncbi:MAG: transposase [Phycisphaerales bacterium]|nr:MAG: transposase [Phycisphaerales bacterium]